MKKLFLITFLSSLLFAEDSYKAKLRGSYYGFGISLQYDFNKNYGIGFDTTHAKDSENSAQAYILTGYYYLNPEDSTLVYLKPMLFFVQHDLNAYVLEHSFDNVERVDYNYDDLDVVLGGVAGLEFKIDRSIVLQVGVGHIEGIGDIYVKSSDGDEMKFGGETPFDGFFTEIAIGLKF
jgi:hypothetical protein